MIHCEKTVFVFWVYPVSAVHYPGTAVRTLSLRIYTRNGNCTSKSYITDIDNFDSRLYKHLRKDTVSFGEISREAAVVNLSDAARGTP